MWKGYSTATHFSLRNVPRFSINVARVCEILRIWRRISSEKSDADIGEIVSNSGGENDNNRRGLVIFK
ncbi:MAG: hypothetical protein KDE52_14670, partial [Calditrichaeota bacterium]|nr:hypothetical protein [Calditrichota bacterium]